MPNSLRGARLSAAPTSILPNVSTKPEENRPIRVLLLCGGQSGEHEVSLASARAVLSAIGAPYEVSALVIDKGGQWQSLPQSARVLGVSAPALSEGAAPALTRLQEQYDVVFPLLHGPNGEDGTVQGLLTLLGLPFVGSGVLGSAASMDKAMTKEILRAAGIPQTPYRLLTRQQWHTDPTAASREAAELGYPLFVKPANLGSSVGISRVTEEGQLQGALEAAFALDRRVVLDRATAHKPRELEVGVLGNGAPQASVVGELSFDAAFYDYETKYTEGRAAMHIPAQVPASVSERIRELALRAYAALDCAGLARIDFFYVQQTGELFLNEVNTMPGFTSTSMYPKLWEASGLTYPQLLSRLLELALEER